ncbi:MAG: F0F1 ATP synthase subunit delta [Ignavibacteriales bacterium]|nr:F0F1 ATP synthase subunit delta [Ignavibacteriales bacterium]
MSQVRIAYRYAQALMSAAEESKQIDAIVADVELLRKTIQASRELFLFLKSPIIKREKKRDILKKLFEKKVQPMAVEFLELLAEKGREEVLPEIINEFFRLHDERRGVVNVQVVGAADFTREQTQTLERKLAAYTKKTVKLAFNIDKEVRGGFVAQVGDTVFDGSVKRQLELMRQRFAEGTAGQR